MSLVEYLFVDDRRLDSYVEQIGPPVAYDRVPTWTVDVSAAGPKVGRSQAKSARSLTQHEKIRRLTEHLEKEKLVSEFRPYSRQGHSIHTEHEALSAVSRPTFVSEVCAATRLVIPKPEGERSQGHLTMWLSEAPNRRAGDVGLPAGLLCLLEDFQEQDSPVWVGHYLLGWASATTVLEALLAIWYRQLRESIIGNVEADEEGTPADMYRLIGKHQQSIGRFMRDPLGALVGMGCRLGMGRRIRVLYRVRWIGLSQESQYQSCDAVTSGSTIATIGYPIFVTEEGLV